MRNERLKMKTTSNQDKATAKPLFYEYNEHSIYGHHEVRRPLEGTFGENVAHCSTKDEALRIVNGYNEYAALMALEEAAQDADALLDSLDLRPAHQCTASQLREALAALAAVRGQ